MITKYLIKQVDITPDPDSDAKPFKLEYYLLEGEVNYIAELIGKKVYGIGIIQKNSPSLMNEERVLNFSCCRETTEEIIQKLIKNTVTPTELPYILDDMLGV